LPSALNANGMTRLEHDFIVNTTPVQLRGADFADQTDAHSFFTPMTVGPDKGFCQDVVSLDIGSTVEAAPFV